MQKTHPTISSYTLPICFCLLQYQPIVLDTGLISTGFLFHFSLWQAAVLRPVGKKEGLIYYDMLPFLLLDPCFILF